MPKTSLHQLSGGKTTLLVLKLVEDCATLSMMFPEHLDVPRAPLEVSIIIGQLCNNPWDT